MSGIRVVALISVCLICYRREIHSEAYKLSTVNISTSSSAYNRNIQLSKGRYINRYKEGIKYYSDSFPNAVDVTQNKLINYTNNILCTKVPNEKTNSTFCGSKLQESILDHTMIPVNDQNKDPIDTNSDDKPELRYHSQHHADETENVYSSSEKEESGITTSQALTNIVMAVEYDGGEYSGFVGPNHFYNEEKAKTLNRVVMPWTKQKGLLKSISNEISRAMAIIHGYMPKSRKKKRTDGEQLTKDMEENNEDDSHFPDTLPPERRFTLIAASRTDKGVHATETACQYLSFDKEPPYNGDIDAIMDKVNRLLPDDIRVSAMIHAPTSDFHVRFDNLGKHYTYKVDISESPNIFERKYYWQIMKDSQFRNTLMKKYNDVRQHFSFESMQKGADVIQGTHNFEGFRKKSRGNEKALIKDPICTIEKIDIKRDRDDPENKFHIAVYGNRFLYKMVRGIVSHLVMVAYGILTSRDIERILETGEALPEIQYAPCNGLYLSKVIFASEVEALLSASKERRIKYLKELYKPSNTIEPNLAI